MSVYASINLWFVPEATMLYPPPLIINVPLFWKSISPDLQSSVSVTVFVPPELGTVIPQSGNELTVTVVHVVSPSAVLSPAGRVFGNVHVTHFPPLTC